MNIKNHKLMLWATRPDSIWWNQGFFEYAIRHGCKTMYNIPIGKDKSDYVVDELFDKACLNIGKGFIRDHKTLLSEYEKRKKDLFKISAELSKKAGKASDKELSRIYKRYWGHIDNFQPYMMFPHYSERFLEPLLKQKFPDDFHIITSLSKPIDYMKMQLSLLKETPKAVAKKIGYLGAYALVEEPFNEEYFRSLKVNKEELYKSLKEIRDNKKEFKRFIRKIKSQKDRTLCTILHEFAYIRTDRVDAFKKHLVLLIPFADYLANKISKGAGRREASMLLRDEIIILLERGEHMSAEEFIERGKRKAFMAIYTKKGASFTYDPKAMQDIISRYRPNIEEITEVKGISACKGIAKGRVKLYLNKTDMDSGESGYIMVAKHTQPQDAVYMKKAIAIVADEGGVTSHAAIVSRELGIPCIVGAKIATSVFKDGDLVEVDAYKGIVRKLKNR